MLHKQCNLGPISDFQFSDDVMYVSLHGTQRHAEPMGYDLVWHAATQQPEHRPLARCQFGNSHATCCQLFAAEQQFPLPRLVAVRPWKIAAAGDHQVDGCGGDFQSAECRDVALQIQLGGQVGGRLGLV